MRAALLAPILPRVMKEGESKKAALILIGHYGSSTRPKLIGMCKQMYATFFFTKRQRDFISPRRAVTGRLTLPKKFMHIANLLIHEVAISVIA